MNKPRPLKEKRKRKRKKSWNTFGLFCGLFVSSNFMGQMNEKNGGSKLTEITPIWSIWKIFLGYSFDLKSWVKWITPKYWLCFGFILLVQLWGQMNNRLKKWVVLDQTNYFFFVVVILWTMTHFFKFICGLFIWSNFWDKRITPKVWWKWRQCPRLGQFHPTFWAQMINPQNNAT